MDEKIKKLVDAILKLGLRTDASCEGHLEEIKHHHPWVSYNPFSNDSVLQALVVKYNETHEIKWGRGNGKGSLAPAEGHEYSCCAYKSKSKKNISKERLEQLQESADELADLIFAHIAEQNKKRGIYRL